VTTKKDFTEGFLNSAGVKTLVELQPSDLEKLSCLLDLRKKAGIVGSRAKYRLATTAGMATIGAAAGAHKANKQGKSVAKGATIGGTLGATGGFFAPEAGDLGRKWGGKARKYFEMDKKAGIGDIAARGLALAAKYPGRLRAATTAAGATVGAGAGAYREHKAGRSALKGAAIGGTIGAGVGFAAPTVAHYGAKGARYVGDHIKGEAQAIKEAPGKMFGEGAKDRWGQAASEIAPKAEKVFGQAKGIGEEAPGILNAHKRAYGWMQQKARQHVPQAVQNLNTVNNPVAQRAVGFVKENPMFVASTAYDMSKAENLGDAAKQFAMVNAPAYLGNKAMGKVAPLKWAGDSLRESALKRGLRANPMLKKKQEEEANLQKYSQVKEILAQRARKVYRD